jgi:hypothetical protein
LIEFQYFEGCPNSAATLENLMALVAEGIVDKAEVKIVEVPDAEAAERLHFQGSPSILVDGIDIHTGEKPSSSSYTCRIYSIEGKRSGILGKDFLRGKLARRGV